MAGSYITRKDLTQIITIIKHTSLLTQPVNYNLKNCKTEKNLFNEQQANNQIMYVASVYQSRVFRLIKKDIYVDRKTIAYRVFWQ